jgi:hypothetical protein
MSDGMNFYIFENYSGKDLLVKATDRAGAWAAIEDHWGVNSKRVRIIGSATEIVEQTDTNVSAIHD